MEADERREREAKAAARKKELERRVLKENAAGTGLAKKAADALLNRRKQLDEQIDGY